MRPSRSRCCSVLAPCRRSLPDVSVMNDPVVGRVLVSSCAIGSGPASHHGARVLRVIEPHVTVPRGEHAREPPALTHRVAANNRPATTINAHTVFVLTSIFFEIEFERSKRSNCKKGRRAPEKTKKRMHCFVGRRGALPSVRGPRHRTRRCAAAACPPRQAR